VFDLSDDERDELEAIVRRSTAEQRDGGPGARRVGRLRRREKRDRPPTLRQQRRAEIDAKVRPLSTRPTRTTAAPGC
jgi:hypothetical protein